MKRLLQLCFFTGCFAAPLHGTVLQLTFTAVNGANAFGYYVGPAYINTGSTQITAFCDDFANDVGFGDTWQANVSTITAGSDLSQTRYGSLSNALQDYQEIAWLDTQFAIQPVSQYADLQATIWQIFNPAISPSPSSNYWLLQAQQNYQSAPLDEFRVLTNTAPVLATGQVQEFLTILSSSQSLAQFATAVPEPDFLVPAAGFLLLGVSWLRRLSKR